ncbi:thioredoxin-domain-containing protein [Basidiobolus meristosporus CBS 931.73]|uniref:Thioredoxin-domain-containing protein n=1 Tax=Basidiobolus meristosporus CBS 931.73 TaxID=1314790 RepID=A0A1Y1XVG1_9FUNG|nr:thioredoxin-domain-containing protein [Basidiobolus meristosporus CBS 931.73]|eukprot:ORX89752.1 thioredoxin-domain-containing protein [Basidiobolus meristosporus CBS 931.73]
MQLLKTFLLAFGLQSISALNLTPDTYEENVSSGIWFVQFYSPYCRYCRELAPLWNELDLKLAPKVEGKDFHLARVDCIEFKEFCEQRGVTEYPTLHLFKQGEKVDQFTGVRSYDNFEQFLLPRIGNAQLVRSEDAPESVPAEQVVINAPTEQGPPINPDGEVVILDSDSFDKLTGPWFIKFFAPWCGHCKKLAPTWEELGSKLKNTINVGSVDCTDHEGICKRNEIRGYPTLKFLQDGNSISYSGPRTLEKLSDFALKASNSKIEEVNPNQLDQIKSGNVTFVYFHSETSPEEPLNTVKSVVNTLFIHSFFYTSSNPKIAEELGIRQTPALVVFKEGLRRQYENPLDDKAAVQEWITTEQFPLLTQIESQNSEALLRSPHLVVMGVLDPSSADFPQSLQQLHDSASEYYMQETTKSLEHVTFVWIDGVQWARYVSKVFSITEKSMPSVILAHLKDDTYYDADAQEVRLLVQKDGILKAISAAQNGELKGKSTLDFFSRGTKRVYVFLSPVVVFFKNYPLAIVGVLLAAIAATVYLVIRCLDDDSSTYEEHVKEE